MSGCTICGTAAIVPRQTVTSAELDQRLGHSLGWTESKFHIRSRAVARSGETSSSLGAEAACQAIVTAGWEASSLDVIIGACAVMEQPIPGTACLIQRRLGLGNTGIPAFDVNATCLSFLVALDQACLGFLAGRWRRALIVSADIASAALDYSTPGASAIFGDGAAAVCVEASKSVFSVLDYRFETYSDEADLCTLAAGGTRLRPAEDLEAFLAGASFRMDGRRTFLAAARRLPQFLERLLKNANVKPDEIDVVIPHQASASALAHLGRAFPYARKGIVDIFAERGNQIAASLPSALHAAVSSGRLARGDRALLIGSSAGLSLGGAVLRY